MRHRKSGRLLSPRPSFPDVSATRLIAASASIVMVGLALSALLNRLAAKKAERDNPPIGKFLEVGGLRLHYLERGTGEPLVLLHGNGRHASGLCVERPPRPRFEKYRVIVFTGPAWAIASVRAAPFGRTRPGRLDSRGTPQIGVRRAVVLGHSWGASVALALALKYPEMVKGLFSLLDIFIRAFAGTSSFCPGRVSDGR